MANQDQLVQQLFEKVQEKKTEISKLETPNWETNCSFSFDPDTNSRKNIQVVNTDVLIEILSFLKMKQEYHAKATISLGFETSLEKAMDKFEWCGFTVAEWEHDLKIRSGKIYITDKKKELDDLEKRLDKLVSPEFKAKMELEEIAKLLG